MTHPPTPGDHYTWTDPQGRDHAADVIGSDGNQVVVVLDEQCPFTVNPNELH